MCSGSRHLDLTDDGMKTNKAKPRVFTTSELADVVGLPSRKILSFIERGYVSPSVQDAAGDPPTSDGESVRQMWLANGVCSIRTSIGLVT